MFSFGGNSNLALDDMAGLRRQDIYFDDEDYPATKNITDDVL